METIRVSELNANNEYSGDLMLDSKFLLLPAKCPLPQETIKALIEWSFTSVSSENAVVVETPPKPVVSQEMKKEISKTTEDVTELVIEKPKKDESKEEVVEAEVLDALKKAEERKTSITNDHERMEMVQDIYMVYLNYINKVYTYYATNKEFKKGEIFGTVRSLCKFLKTNQRYMLRISIPQDKRNYFLVYHSIRSTVLAITIGLQLRMSEDKLVELGVATMLHEIGMLTISPQLYMNNKPLTAAERKLILMHPLVSYNILKSADFSLPILMGVLDHHERENGSGYPRHRRGSDISYYAKIIATVCTFEAITAPREFKEARTTYDAMVEMLKNENHLYDETVVKALLFSLSLYPIGAYAYLSNGKVAQVVDVNPTDPRNPIVQIVGMKNPDGSPVTMTTNGTDVKIVRVLDNKEASDVVAALSKTS